VSKAVADTSQMVSGLCAH